MTLPNHYHQIKQKIESDDFTFKSKSIDHLPPREECQKNSHLESINYLMFEFMTDRKDKRKRYIFDYVCIPKGIKTIDFSIWNIEDFLKQIMTLKD